MANLSLRQHLDRAGAFARLVDKHRDDLAELAHDVPKAIDIAADFHALFAGHQEQASVAAAKETAPEAAVAAPKITATQASKHVKANGLSAQERAAFDRASGASG
jgi:hypothetical protein